MDTLGQIREFSKRLGFDLLGIIPVQPSQQTEQLDQWLKAGMAGEMEWIHRGQDKREDPRKVLPQAKTIIMVGVNYYNREILKELLNEPSRGIIAIYAWFDDYHDIVKGILKKYFVCDQ